MDDKGVQHSVHYIAGPETGYRVLKHVKGPHLPTVFPFGRPEIISPDFYDSEKGSDVFDTAASGHIKPGGSKPTSGSPIGGTKDEVPSFGNGLDDGKDQFSFGNKKPFGSGKPTGAKPSYFDDEESGDFGDIFGGDGTVSSTTPTPRPRPTGGYKPPRPTSNEDDGSYKPSGEDGSYRPPIPELGPSTSTFKPLGFGSGVTTSKPSPDSSEVGYGSGERPYPSFDEASTRPSVRPQPGGNTPSYNTKPPDKPSYGGNKPSFENDYSSNEVNDFGLFGSETGRPRPPYTFGEKPLINIGVEKVCPKCSSTLVTNVGDRSFYISPGVSVRAHVQAIDLLPVNPSIPSPSEQFNAELKVKTEQLNAAEDDIFNNNNHTSIRDSRTTTSSTVRSVQERNDSTKV